MNKFYLFFIKYKFIILAGLLLILSIFVFDVFWIDLISEYWVEPVMSKLYSHEWIVFLLLTTFFAVYYLSAFQLSRKLSKIKLGVYFVYSIIYLICFFSCQWKYSLIIDNYLITAWTHLTLLPWFLEIALFIKLNKNKKLKLPILEKESTRDVFDSYGRNNLVKTSVELLKNCFYNNGSFVVSVKGDWGLEKLLF